MPDCSDPCQGSVGSPQLVDKVWCACSISIILNSHQDEDEQCAWVQALPRGSCACAWNISKHFFPAVSKCVYKFNNLVIVSRARLGRRCLARSTWERGGWGGRWAGGGSRGGGHFAALDGPLPGSTWGHCDIVHARKCGQMWGMIMAMVNLLVLVIMNN